MHPLILKSRALKHYLRPPIAHALAQECQGREVAVKYLTGFGKRPDMIETAAEVMELAQKGATSFHISEELWSDPLKIETGMSEKIANELRARWDFVLDVDAPNWDICKIIAAMIVDALRAYGIRTISAKFSGNKGFHIAVPAQAFPETITLDGTDHLMSDLFPDLPRAMARVIIEHIDSNSIRTTPEGGIVLLDTLYTRERLAELLAIPDEEILTHKCTQCGRIQDEERIRIFECPICKHTHKSPERYAHCPKDGVEMRIIHTAASACSTCGSTQTIATIATERIMHLDTLLISSRHLFRSPYSLHEKSGLASIPLPPENIRAFRREYAHPDYIATPTPFLTAQVRESARASEGRKLVDAAITTMLAMRETPTYSDDVELPDRALDESYFPPCIKKLMDGVEDGRKRSVFILINYLRSIGWEKENVEAIVASWNEKNPTPLRQVYIKAQIRHAFNNKIILPPNCDHKDYMLDIGVCVPDQLCTMIKNPAQYSKRKYDTKTNG